MAKIIEEERPKEEVVIHEREREVPARTGNSNLGWIIAIVVILLLLFMLFGRGLFGGGGDSGSPDVNVTPPTTDVNP